jgi:hypothetical protein
MQPVLFEAGINRFSQSQEEVDIFCEWGGRLDKGLSMLCLYWDVLSKLFRAQHKSSITTFNRIRPQSRHKTTCFG